MSPPANISVLPHLASVQRIESLASALLVVALIAGGLAFGFVAWTLTEYLAHRFTMHGTRGRGPAAREHLMHHAKPARTRRFIRTVGHLGMYLTAVAIGLLLSLLVSTVVAATIAIGWALGYTAYEGTHFHAHHHRPRGRYDLWLRRRHFHHHFVSPQSNHGVLVPWWDQLFGTEVNPDVIPVPRRVAMTWLLDTDGAIRDDYRGDYVLAGTGRAGAINEQQQASDIEAAFANQPLPLT